MADGVKINLNGESAIRTIRDKLGEAIEKVGFNTQRSVVEEFTKFPKPPIDSGGLRQSIKYKKTGVAQGEVSANKEYAKYVEFGTIRMEPRPYMRNGVNSAKKTNLQILKAYLKK